MDGEQPLNVEIGKTAADDMFRRRDRSEVIAWWAKDIPRNELAEWISENYPDGFPREWFV